MMRPHVLTRRHGVVIPQPRLPRTRLSGTDPVIRRRTPKDLAAATRLLRLVYFADHYPVRWPESPRAWLDDEGVMDAWVAQRQGELLGHVTISRVGLDEVSKDRWREMTGRDADQLGGVSRLFVRPSARGQGIGTTLLDVAAAGIRARGRMPVLDVVSGNRDAIRLYEKQGWRLLDMRPWGDRSSTLRMYCFAQPGPAQR